jgi:hypothetical protein
MPKIRAIWAGSTVLAGLCFAAPITAQTAIIEESAAAAQPIDVLNTLVGEWDGTLEYLDYGADEWFGIPARTTIQSGGDGVTFIRTTDFDDGPKIGIIRITSISMVASDGVTEYSNSFRKGRVPELTNATLRVGSYTDAAHWVMMSEGAGMDANRPATLRLTTTRDGARVVTLKEVDFTDDDKAEWLTRNRTIMVKVE